MQSTLLLPQPSRGLHAALIMDGNGRWATMRGLPRVMGHREGAQVVRRIVEAAPGLGIGTMTLYAFSSDNWGRPPREVTALMRLFRAYLASETARCVETGVRMRVIGRRDRLGAALLRQIEAAETATAGGDRMLLRIAIDYSARDALMRAAALANGAELDRDAFAALLARAQHDEVPAPDVDLLIRTGGEQRLSDFLLWESAYAELYFTPRMWPDFGPPALAEAVEWFRARDRRFGKLKSA
jgi:undecaprenyl diphosphate synthase